MNITYGSNLRRYNYKRPTSGYTRTGPSRFIKRFRRRINYSNNNKTSVGKYLRTNQDMIKCEFDDILYVTEGAADVRFGSTSQPYVNLHTILQATASWANNANNFSFYKIKGIAMRVARAWDGLTSAFNNGLMPPVYINMFPGMTGTDNGVYCSTADSSFRVDPFVTGVQSRYIRIPENFSSGNGNGLGENNNISTISNLSGEINAYAATPADAIASLSLFQIRIVFYVVFCNSTK